REPARRARPGGLGRRSGRRHWPLERPDQRPGNWPRLAVVDDRAAPGYRRVDDDPEVDALIARMDETARWDAILRLRSWERQALALAPGQRLLDVGCGLGDAGLALAKDLGEAGELVGIDASAAMLEVARARARSAPCRV